MKTLWMTYKICYKPYYSKTTSNSITSIINKKIGLAMGAPASAIIAETYLQSLEHNQVYNSLTNHKIIGYFRYVDDILII
jgi:hypothetical protein